jgi:nucleoside-diphosphate-sugar epimerase
MKAFVTGGTGFVGSHLVDALLERDVEVTCLVRTPAKLMRLFPSNPPHLVQGDLDNERAILNGLDGADVVYHVAGATAARDRDEFFTINAEGTRRVAEATGHAAPNARFIYVSSLAAAGPTSLGQPLTESVRPRPVSAYGASKLAGEDAVKRTSLRWTVVRPPAVYGPRDTQFARVFKLARWGFMPLVGGARQELSLVYVADLVSALVALAAKDVAQRTYFACHREVLTGAQVALTIHDAVQKALAPTKRSRRTPLVVSLPRWLSRAAFRAMGTAAGIAGRATILSSDKVNELLAEAWTCSPEALERDAGWTAQTPLSHGAFETAVWYREHRRL